MIPFPKIKDFESDSLLFRDLKPSDASKLFKIYANKEAMKYRNSKAMTSLKDAENFIIHQKLENEKSYIIRKGIALKQKGELIGSAMYQYNKEVATECEIGYSIVVDYWGKGYGRAIVKMLVESIQAQAGIDIIKAWTRKENIASKRILELNDFQQVEQEQYPESYLYCKILFR